jgi:hypothetical protein
MKHAIIIILDIFCQFPHYLPKPCLIYHNPLSPKWHTITNITSLLIVLDHLGLHKESERPLAMHGTCVSVNARSPSLSHILLLQWVTSAYIT